MMKEITMNIQELCIAKGWTLSAAESCTGGLLAARLTCIPDCSRYFLGSVVAYSNLLKMNVLGVNPETLETYGAVSGQVVGEMAHGIQALSGSDFSLAVSGIAGPGGGSEEKPVGTIWAAIMKRGEDPVVWQFTLKGTRQEIIEQTVETVLKKCLQIMSKVLCGG